MNIQTRGLTYTIDSEDDLDRALIEIEERIEGEPVRRSTEPMHPRIDRPIDDVRERRRKVR